MLHNSPQLAHLGGFLMGLLVGTTLYPVISTTKRHRMIVWGFRILAIPLAIVLFVVLIRNFLYLGSICRYVLAHYHPPSFKR